METDERLLPVPEIKGPKSKQSLEQQNAEYPASYSPMYDDDSFADRRSIREYFNVIYKRLPYILAITIVTTAAAAFYMYRQPSVYRATTDMIIEARKPKIQNTQSVNINFGADQNYYNTQLELLQNPELMKTVIVELGLHKNKDLLANNKRSILTTVRSMFSGGEVEKPKVDTLPIITAQDLDENGDKKSSDLTKEEEENARRYAGYFARRLSVQQVPKTDLVKIRLRMKIRILRQRFRSRLRRSLCLRISNSRQAGQKKAYNELTQSINELRDNILNQEQEFIKTMQSSGLPLGEGKVNELAAEILSKLSGQLLDAIDERRKLEAQFNATRAAKNPYGLSDSSGADVASELRTVNRERVAKLDEEIRSYDDKIRDAEAELEKLKVRYTDDYVKVKEARAQVAKLKSTRDTVYKDRSRRLAADNKKSESDVQRDITSGLAGKVSAARKRENQLRECLRKGNKPGEYSGNRRNEADHSEA